MRVCALLLRRAGGSSSSTQFLQLPSRPLPIRSLPPFRRPFTSTPPPAPKKDLRARLSAINARFPTFVQRWTSPLIAAPISQVVSFLILHEITAFVPLVALTATFHYTNWIPSAFAEWKYARAGLERFGRYARRKGWAGDDEVRDAEREVRAEEKAGEGAEGKGRWGKRFGGWKEKRASLIKSGEKGVPWLIEVAVAYAIVKAFVIPRLILSAWATPWFARVAVTPIGNAMGNRAARLTERILGRKKS